MSLFLCLSGSSMGQYCQKSLAKVGGLEKIQKGGMAI